MTLPPWPTGIACRTLLLVGALLALSGCHTWQEAPATHEDAPPAGTVRLHTADGSRLVLANLEVRGDSLYGEDPGCHWQLALARAPGRAWCSGMAIARADVVGAQVRVPAPFRTNMAILVFGLFGCAFVVACLEIFSDVREGRRAKEPRAASPGSRATRLAG